MSDLNHSSSNIGRYVSIRSCDVKPKVTIEVGVWIPGLFWGPNGFEESEIMHKNMHLNTRDLKLKLNINVKYLKTRILPFEHLQGIAQSL